MILALVLLLAASTFDDAVRLARGGQWAEAERLLTPYLATHGADAQGWYWLGQARLYQKKFDEALTAMERSVALDAAYAPAHRVLGEIQLERHEYNQAYQAWLAAHKLDPQDARTTYYLGRLFLEADFHQQAAAWFRKTLALNPQDYRAMNYLGVCAERLHFPGTAVELYRRSISASRAQGAPFSWAYTNLAKTLREAGKDAEAKKLLEEAARDCPDARVLTALAPFLPPGPAEASYRRAIALDGSLAEAHYRLAQLLRAAGRTAESQAELKAFQAAKAEEERNKTQIIATVKEP